ncbi:MAG: O-antigen ligase family protein [Acidobacteriota bacterium]|nr:MAG: O-antigen ligase family protein [Acidobacteriota bacterium]
MHIIALLPGFAALFVSLRWSPAVAFVYVYIPTLLFFPDYYRWIAPGLPDPNFHQAAILPIVAIYLWNGGQWQFTPTDLIVLGFAFCVGFSQYLATGYADAQNLIFAMLCSVILPYALAKALIEPAGIRVEFAKVSVLVLGAIAILSLYEFRFILNPFQLYLRPFFPGLGYGWVSNIRWGFGRVAGPFAHAILAGVMFAVGFRIQRWLQSGGHWGSSKKHRRFAQLLTFGMVCAMAITLSRGPWIGSILGAAPAYLGRVKKRKNVLILLMALGFLVGVPAYLGFKAYVSVGRAGASSDTQETAAYRKELFDKYLSIALERSTWGWGQTTVPKVPGMESVDNYWLLLALMHGTIALGFFALLFVVTSLRLTIAGFRTAPYSDDGRLAFDLVGIYLMYMFSITTVFLGTQTQPMLFLVTGWAEGLLMSMKYRKGDSQQPARELKSPSFQFKRVLS